MATDIDLRVISTFSTLSEAAISSVLDAPTSDSVKSLLKAIELNARECEQSKSQKVRLEVELETVVRTNESKVKVLQNSRDKALGDVQKLRGDLHAAETNRAKAEADLEQIRSTSTSEAAETSSLRSRVSSLEASNRDTLALLESKTNAYEKLSQDLSAQHQKAIDLRKHIVSLEQTVQQANSSASTFRFKEQSLQQEIDLLKKNNEWLENERNIKADEHTSFRKDKNARIAELSRSNEQYISEAEALKRSESAFRRRLEEQVNKYEDSLQDLQRLREEKINDADVARAEIENIKRLQELQQASAQTAKARVEELNELLQEKDDEFADQLGEIRAAADNDHADKEAAESKIIELETKLSQLQSELEQAQAQPRTPQHHFIGNGAATPVRPSTPLGIFSPSNTSKSRSNLSATQMYSENTRLEKLLSIEKRKAHELQESIDELVQQVEAHQPELEQALADHARIQSELLEMSNLLDAANRERDTSVKDARSSQGHLTAKTKEVEIVTQQLRDMSAEIRYLLMEQEIHRRGDSLSREDYDQMQQYADEAMEQATADLSHTQRMINERLIVFKNVTELQQQNQDQLTTIRNLVTNLEDAQSEERQQQFSDMETSLETANVKIVSLEDEIRGLMNQSKSFMKERNMFRDMLNRRGHREEHGDFSRSLPAANPGSPAPGFGGSVNGAAAEFKEAVTSIQQQFDAYRQESSTTQSTLRGQIDGLSKRNSELQTESSRAQGQLMSVTQRNEMLQANLDLSRGENNELSKRNYSLTENGTKQELRAQQVAEEVVEARNMIDSLRRDSANLKAEKDLWKTIEKRLLDETESLRNERSRVDQMNNSLQTLLNEREQADSENRRRLQSQAESLEIELQSTKRRLSDEQKDHRQVSSRREYEQEQNQKKIDDLVSGLSSSREELASAKTSRDHLQARVDELTIELRSAEERIAVLSKPSETPGNVEDDVISKEQELAIEVSELKRDMELKQSDLERLHEQIEVYKNISQSSEERLEELTDTYEKYREETDVVVAEKDAKVADLQQRVEDISSELNSTNSALSKVRDEQSESARRLEEQKASFETEIARLKDQEERYAEQAQFNLETTKEQARIAVEAQQNYEEEVVKHGQAANLLQTVRTEANQLRLEMVDLRSQAESAQTNLQQKESSWSDMKDRYERELADLKKRREEVQQQNTLLHGQLEQLTQQVSSVQKDRAAHADAEAATPSAGGLDSLQEVIKYLRQEKEIVDVQLHMATQDAKRLRQQLDFTKNRLDDAQLKLDQQRIVEVDSERNTTSHNKLMETLSELNLFRESSVTLRAEAKQAKQSLVEKTKRVEELEDQIQPLSAKVAEFEHLAELREGEMKILQTDRDQWQQRTENILSKYNRVDPSELEAMKEQLSSLQSERDVAATARDELQAQLDGVPDQIKAAQAELRERLQEQFKSKVRELNGKIKEKQADVDEITRKKDEIASELDVVREQLESARNHVNSPAAQVNGDTAKSPGEITGDSSERVVELESRVAELESTLAQKGQELSSLQSERKTKEDQLKEMLNARLKEVKEEKTAAIQTALDEQEQRLNSEHQKQMEELRAQSIPVADQVRKPSEPEDVTSSASVSAEDPSDDVLINMSEEKARFTVQKNQFVNRLVANNIKKRTESLKKEIEELKAAATSDGGDVQSPQKIQELEQQLAAAEQDKASALATQKESLEQDFTQRAQQSKLEFDEEAKKKIEQQVANAELMATKKGQLQLGMAQNKLKTATAQIDVVKKAAEETPERAVSEVWEEAKVAKPAPTSKPAAKASTPPPATPTKAEPNSLKPATPPVATSNATTSEPKADNTGPQPEQQNVPNGPTKSAPAPDSSSIAPRTSQIGLPRGGVSSIPRGGIRGAMQNAQGGGRGATQTGIPRGAFQAGRGRGGQGRGSMQLVNNNAGVPAAGRGGGMTSARTSLSGGAPTFVPGGAKRARDDGDGNNEVGKRIRGGGAGGS